jgi:hypothetical protein
MEIGTMARFYFHMRKQGRVALDEEGTDLPELAAARDEAIQSAREILANAMKDPEPNLFDCFVVADEKGDELAIVSLRDALPKGLC